MACLLMLTRMPLCFGTLMRETNDEDAAAAAAAAAAFENDNASAYFPFNRLPPSLALRSIISKSNFLERFLAPKKHRSKGG